MKIAVDCCDLDYSRIDGTRVYIKNLLDWFGELSSDEFLLYHKKDFNPLLKPKSHTNYIDRKIPYPVWWTQTRFAFELRQDRPDICWMPIQQIPFIGPEETKYVVTIHDLAFKIFKDHFALKDRLKLNFFADTAVKNADKIIAISQATKKDILKFYPKIPEEKIAVIHHGFDSERFSRRCSKEETKRVLLKYKIIPTNHQPPTTNYILYVGAIQPRKNLVTLVKAFEQIREREIKNPLNPPLKKGEGTKLVLVGEVAWKAESTLDAIRKSHFKDDIVMTGKIDFDELACLYQAAAVSVYPSLYEGFGIPILESFASGTPTVIADNSSLPEVAGEAAEKFSSRNSDELAGILQKILNNRTMREEMSQSGLQRAAQFSWRKCAKETLDILKLQKTKT